MPALAKAMEMPPPMVPAPTMPTLAICRKGVPFGMSGIFDASRSEKNTYCRAVACGAAWVSPAVSWRRWPVSRFPFC